VWRDETWGWVFEGVRLRPWKKKVQQNGRDFGMHGEVGVVGPTSPCVFSARLSCD
jgi:hypothetical protein